jgi:hypothetical protein
MTKATSGQNGRRKYLKPALLLSLVFCLLWSSILWAGPMGDPEPVGADGSQVPMGDPADDQPETGSVAAALADIELAIIVLDVVL